jgi:hypothetical protein
MWLNCMQLPSMVRSNITELETPTACLGMNIKQGRVVSSNWIALARSFKFIGGRIMSASDAMTTVRRQVRYTFINTVVLWSF